MAIQIAETQPYIITLDTIDSKYLYACMSDRRNADVIPLWSRPNGENQCYQFQITTEKDKKEKPFKLSTLKSYKCYICNTLVPNIFKERHCNSTKHQNFKKLIKKVLVRTRKSIDTLPVNNMAIPKDVYYCTCCSEAVLIKDKTIHELSEGHMKSLKYDTLMSDFINLYTNKNVKAKKLKAIEHYYYDNKILSNSYVNLKHSEEYINNSFNLNNDDNEINLKLDNESQVSINSDSEIINSDNSNNTKMKYEYHVSNEDLGNDSENSHRNLKINNVNKSMSSTEGNKVINLSIDRDVDVSKLCEKIDELSIPITIENTKEKDQSKMKKIKHVKTVVKDDNVIKEKDDNNIKIIEGSKRKEMDNDTFIKRDDHETEERNKNDRKPVAILEGEPLILSMNTGNIKVPLNHFHGLKFHDDRIFCYLCNSFVGGKTENHIDKKKHVDIISKPIPKDFIREVDKIFAHCIVCNVIMPQALANINHTNTETHKEMLNNFTTKEPKLVPHKTRCELCDHYVKPIDYTTHIQSKKHLLLRLNKFGNKNISDYITNVGHDDSETYCKICNVKIPNTENDVKEHKKAMKHRMNLLEFTNENKIKFIIDDYYYCEVCKIDFDNLFEHIHEINHKNNAPRNNLIEQTEIYIDETNNGTITQKKSKEVKQNITSIQNNNDFCDVCNVNLPLHGKLTHETGKRHKANLSKITTTNNASNNPTTLEHLPDNTKYLLYDHNQMLIDKHAKDAFITLTDRDEILCKYCNDLVNNCKTLYEEHLNSNRHIKNLIASLITNTYLRTSYY